MQDCTLTFFTCCSTNMKLLYYKKYLSVVYHQNKQVTDERTIMLPLGKLGPYNFSVKMFLTCPHAEMQTNA